MMHMQVRFYPDLHGEGARRCSCSGSDSDDLEMDFNKIALFGKEDEAKKLQDRAAKTQDTLVDTLVDAVENDEVAEIKRAVFSASARLQGRRVPVTGLKSKAVKAAVTTFAVGSHRVEEERHVQACS